MGRRALIIGAGQCSRCMRVPQGYRDQKGLSKNSYQNIILLYIVYIVDIDK